MKILSKLTTLLLGVILGGAFVVWYFNVPVNINPITVISTGDGDVEIKNEVNQGAPPPPQALVPIASPLASPATTISRIENDSSNTVPSVAEPQQALPQTASIPQRPARTRYLNHTPQDVNPDCDEPEVFSDPTPGDVCTYRIPGVVRRAEPETVEESATEPQSNGTRGYSRSTSSSVITVNGRVVSSSSVTTVNGRVVNRTVFPPDQ